jgi:hypothetical protein
LRSIEVFITAAADEAIEGFEQRHTDAQKVGELAVHDADIFGFNFPMAADSRISADLSAILRGKSLRSSRIAMAEVRLSAVRVPVTVSPREFFAVY